MMGKIKQRASRPFVKIAFIKDSVKDTPVDNYLVGTIGSPLWSILSRVIHLYKIFMEEMPSWEDQKKHPTEDFHLDPNKQVDAVEELLERVGPEGAVDDVMSRLDKNPGDAELRREANLLVNRLEDLSSRLRGKIQH